MAFCYTVAYQGHNGNGFTTKIEMVWLTKLDEIIAKGKTTNVLYAKKTIYIIQAEAIELIFKFC